MAYTQVPIQATGDYWTNVQMNTYLRDNMQEIFPDLIVNADRIPVGTGSGTYSEVDPSGASDYDVLMADSSQSAGVKFDRNLKMTILRVATNGLNPNQHWGTEDLDELSCHQIGDTDHDYYITIPADGYYLFIYYGLYTAYEGKTGVEDGFDNIARTELRVNGTRVVADDKVHPETKTSAYGGDGCFSGTCHIYYPAYLESGDVVHLYNYHDNDANEYLYEDYTRWVIIKVRTD